MKNNFFDKSKLDINTSKLEKYPYEFKHWDMMEEVNFKCFGITRDFNNFVVGIDYHHDDDGIGVHRVLAVTSKKFNEDNSEDYWTPISPNYQTKNYQRFCAE